MKNFIKHFFTYVLVISSIITLLICMNDSEDINNKFNYNRDTLIREAAFAESYVDTHNSSDITPNTVKYLEELDIKLKLANGDIVK